MIDAAEAADGVFISRVAGKVRDRANWPWMAEWLMKHAQEWEANFRQAIERPFRTARP
jgi:hypothetical protein